MSSAAGMAAARDEHSFSNPHDVRVRHLDLDLDLDFDERRLRGSITLSFDRAAEADEVVLILDTRELAIHGVDCVGPSGPVETSYRLGRVDPVLGAPLTIPLSPDTTQVRVRYETSPDASGLQWLTPEQTAGQNHPFMFTQSQAIHARSWIPLQDSPGVRVTYTARVRTPLALRAVMGATNDPTATAGDYVCEMVQPIPSYLIALAVGDLAFQPLGERTGVYAEPSVVASAAREFEDTEAMIQATERLYGPYRWGRYDLLVLPPSFPFGGMENPRLTFATPTILAGDKSLVSLVAHELAHSWSGNLVTNATWRDFWLNEGFTTYIERRIIEELYGRPRGEMEAVLGRQVLQGDLDRLDDPDEVLHVDLTGRDPDDGMTHVPYEKGALFLLHLEERVGRPRFDEFIRDYFEAFAFQSITTADFVSYVGEHLPSVNQADIGEWIHRPGLPTSAPQPESDALYRVEAQSSAWRDGSIVAAKLDTGAWTTHEWLHFLTTLPEALSLDQLSELDAAFGLTESGNSEIAHAWLLLAIHAGYSHADSQLEQYLTRIGRRKLIQPLYEALVATPSGHERALAIYRRARPGYHPISVATIDPIVGWES